MDDSKENNFKKVEERVESAEPENSVISGKRHSGMLTNAKFKADSSEQKTGVLITEDTEHCVGHDKYSEGEDADSSDEDHAADNSFDTDLDIDDDAYLREDVESDCSGVKSYIEECNKLGIIPTSYFVRHIEDRKFVMRYHGLGPLGAKAIAKPLAVNTSIDRLDLQGNCIEALGAKHLSRMLKENLYITELILSENNIGSRGAKAVCNMMLDNTLIQVLDLSGNNLGDLDGELFYHMLQKNNTLIVLLLSHNRFEHNAAVWFKEAMSTNISLRVLDLSWNHFRLQGAVDIADGIKENYGLTDIRLAMNGFGFEGAKAVGNALKHNQILSSLDLSCNRIHSYGAIEIAKGLKVNEKLSLLKLSANPIEPKGSTPLIDAIKRNEGSCMKLLDIQNNRVSEEFDKILTELKATRELCVLHDGVITRKEIKFTSPPVDHESVFWSDPMTKLKKFAENSGLRLVDLFRKFDRDSSWTINKEEFIAGVKSANIPLTEDEIDILIGRLDQDGDGEIDYKELIDGDQEHRAYERQIKAIVKQRKASIKQQSNVES